MNIPKNSAKMEPKNIIPQGVAELPSELEDPEITPYVISFAKYNEKLCEIDCLKKNKPRIALKEIKKIGIKVCCLADFKKHNVDRFPVRCEGEYKKLYRGLEDDIELKEIKLQGTARIFYFDIESEKRLYVVAIKENHLETGKVRR